MPASSYHPSSRSDDDAQSDSDSAPRRGTGKTTIRNAGAAGSGRKKKTLVEELGGQQVLATTESTSYGSGTAVKPIQIKRTFEGESLTKQMQNIVGSSAVPLNPLNRSRVEGSSKAPSNTTATAAKKSTPRKPVRNESPAFDEASEAVDQASFSKTPKAPRGIPVPRKTTPAKHPLSQVTAAAPSKQPMTRPTIPRVEIEMPPPVRSKNPPSKPTTRPRSQTGTSGTSHTSKLLSWTDRTKKFLAGVYYGIKEYIIRILALLGILLLILALIFGTDNAISRNADYQYHTTINNIRHHVPNVVAHPLYWFNDKSISDLNERVTVLEIDVDQLKLDVARDHKAIEGLSKQLPDFVVAKKNKHGEVEIPLDFWHAVKGKITTDKDFSNFGKPGTEKPAAVDWNDFWRSNEQRVKKIASDEVKVSREEIQKIIERDVESAKKHSAEDVAKLRKRIESHYATKSEQISPSQLKKLVDDASHRQLSSSKIEALISNKIREQSSQRMRAYNHFALKMGAFAIAKHSSPTYEPKYDKDVSWGGWIIGKALKQVGTTPPEPLGYEAALMGWDDSGDCWCGKTDKHGVHLQVRTKAHFYPSEIIVEHVNPEATLDKGAAPRDMELFVQIGLAKQDEVASASEAMFPDAEDDKTLDHTWVRIARWTYDLTANENIQVFGLQLDLKRYGVTAREFVVRAKTNWGEPPADHTCFYRIRMHGSIPEIEN